MPLTRGEIKACLTVAADVATRAELADVAGWKDLTSQPDRTADAIGARLAAGATPGDVQVFPWPKDRKGYRAMAWLDPLDQVTNRALIGRLLLPIEASLDRSSVLGTPIATRPPGWRFGAYQAAIEARRRRGRELIVGRRVMGQIDITDFFDSIRRPALEAVLGRLPLAPHNFTAVLDWLDHLHARSDVTGLPIGCDGSQVLANGLLVPADDLFAELRVPFLRYVDDTWCFLDSDATFETVVEAYTGVVHQLGLRVHPDKTKPLDLFEALEAIERSAIAYAEAQMADPGCDHLTTALELFSFAMEDPDERRSELRKALVTLKEHRATEAFAALESDVSLIALAPGQWRGYLRAILSDRKTARATNAGDWLLSTVVAPADDAMAYVNVVLLQAAKVLKPSKTEGRQVLEAALRCDGWAEPVQVGGAYLWGQSQAYRPNTAVELVEVQPTYSTKRAFALTLDCRRGDPNFATYLDGIRHADPELDPTVAWLEAA